MKQMIFFPLLFISCFALAQSVGIGTTTPNSSSVLDLGPSIKPLILPRLSLSQMNGIMSPALGMVIYNTDEHQLYGYLRYHTSLTINQNNDKWQPLSTGPRMVAWGAVDSFAVGYGSGSYTVGWDPANRWYRLVLNSPLKYNQDSMLLMITPVAGGSWDQAVSTRELIEAGGNIASIKFTDVSRIAAGTNSLDSRRRSGFHFILYDLQKGPY